MSQHSASSEEDARRHAAVEVYLPENQAQNVAVSEGVGGSSVSASSAAPTEASLIAAAIAKLSPELAAMAEDKHRKAKSSDPGWKYGFWPDPRKKEFIQCIFCKKVVPTGKCNLFNGEWIPNPSGPAYTNASCRFIDDHQNCMMNGRPDKEYLRWKWKPYGCDLPPFDAVRFLDSMRNKAWGLIGDSILRNQVQSLLCLLSKAEEPVEVYHDKEFKNRRWHFQSYNFTVSIVWAPFLIKSDVFENENGVSTSEIQLHLDILDASWTSQYESFDYIIISGGQWFLKTAVYWENGAVVGSHNSQNKNLAELGFEHLYRKTLQNVFNFIISAKHKPVVFFRTWSPDHFENGEWFNGGSCYRELPYKKGEYREGYIERVMRQIELESFNEAVATLRGSVDVDTLRLMDTYSLSFLRPDGHVGPYRTPYPLAKGSRKSTPVQNDCLHWCVPGPIDAWNDLVMKMALDR